MVVNTIDISQKIAAFFRINNIESYNIIRKMKVDILTLFPEMFEGPFGTSMLKKAQDEELVEINIHNLRDWTKDKHKTVDDRPYGGGPGMVIRVDVVDRAINDLKSQTPNHKSQAPSSKHRTRDTEHGTRVILLSAKGETYSQQKAQELSELEHLILIAGHYEGIDHRVHEHLADEAISIGDYVLTGGEIPAMVVVDSVSRLIPGVLGAEEGLKEESHSKKGYIEYPQYTRPEEYNGWKVPGVLLSGNHAEIEKWREEKSKEKK